MRKMTNEYAAVQLGVAPDAARFVARRFRASRFAFGRVNSLSSRDGPRG